MKTNLKFIKAAAFVITLIYLFTIPAFGNTAIRVIFSKDIDYTGLSQVTYRPIQHISNGFPPSNVIFGEKNKTPIIELENTKNKIVLSNAYIIDNKYVLNFPKAGINTNEKYSNVIRSQSGLILPDRNIYMNQAPSPILRFGQAQSLPENAMLDSVYIGITNNYERNIQIRPDIMTYDMYIQSFVSNIYVQPFPKANNSSVTVNGQSVLIGKGVNIPVDSLGSTVEIVVKPNDGDQTVTGIYHININVVDVSVDKSVISLPGNTDVKLAVKMNGNAVQNADVKVNDNSGTSGRTMADGACNLSLNIDGDRSSIPINVSTGNYSLWYDYLLSSLSNSNQRVLEIKGRTAEGQDIDDFNAYASDKNNKWQDDCKNSKCVRFIIPFDCNEFNIGLTSRTRGVGTSYVLKGSASTSANKLQTVILNDAGASLKVLSFKYDNVPVSFTNVFIEGQYIGDTDPNGEKKIKITSGSYEVSVVKQMSEIREVLFLDFNNTLIAGADSLVELNTLSSGTGLVKLNINKSGSPVNHHDYIILNKTYVEYRDGDALTPYLIRLKQGEYEVREFGINISDKSKDFFVQYKFRMPWLNNTSPNEKITITGGNAYNFDQDISIKSMSISYDPDRITRNGEWTNCNTRIITTSGYELCDIFSNNNVDYNQIHWAFMLGGNTVKELDKHIYDTGCYIDSSFQSGVYTLKTTRNIGPLYTAESSGLQGTAKIMIGRPEVTAAVKGGVESESSNGVLRKNVPVSLKLTFTLGGTPLGNKRIHLSHYQDIITDNNGIASADNYTPWERGVIDIEIDKYDADYNNILTCVEEWENVVELDIANTPEKLNKDFQGTAYNGNDWYSSWRSNGNSSVRLIVSTGEFHVVCSARAEDDSAAYYLIKTIEILQGKRYNRITFDAQDSTSVAVDFKFDNKPLNNADIFISNTTNDYLGMTDESGKKILKVTPGTYQFTAMDDNKDISTALYLVSGSYNITPQQNQGAYSLNCSWDKENTGTYVANYIDPDPVNPMNKGISFNGIDMYSTTDSSFTIVSSPGTYRIEKLFLWQNNSWLRYEYKKYNHNDTDTKDYIDIKAGETKGNTFDLGFKEAKIECKSLSAYKDTSFDFRLRNVTNSNYDIENIQAENKDCNQVAGEITGDGYSKKFNYYYGGGGWDIDDGMATGKYTLKLSRDLGPLYGEKEANMQFDVLPPDTTPPIVTLDTLLDSITPANVNDYVVSGVVDEPHSNIRVILRNSGDWKERYVDADINGNFSVGIEAKYLADGPVTLAVIAKDPRRNESEAITRTINKWTELKAEVDKTIVNVEEDNVVTVKITPPAGTEFNGKAEVRLDGCGISVKGDSVNGEFKTTIYPKYSGNISIRINDDKSYENLLYAIGKDEGLVELTVKNKAGMDLNQANIIIKGEEIDREWYSDNYRVVIRSIAHRGANKVQITGRDYNQNNYYIVKDINITPGIVNDISINADDTVKINFEASFTSDGVSTPLDYESVTLKMENTRFGYRDGLWGRNNNKIVIYATPGDYSVSVNDGQYDRVLYLMTHDLKIDHDGKYYISWSKEEVKTINFNIKNDIAQDVRKSIQLNDEWINMEDKNQLVINKDSYTVRSIVLTPNDSKYEYRKSSDNMDTIGIDSSSYGTDLRLKPVTLNIWPKVIFKDQPFFVEPQLITNFGYVLESTDNINCYMNVTVKDSNGHAYKYDNMNLGRFEYKMYTDDPVGEYKISVEVYIDKIAMPSNSLTGGVYYRAVVGGDADNNGKLDDGDAAAAMNALIGETQVTPQINAATDVDGDGKITSADYVLIKRKLKGMIDMFPIK